MVHPSSLLLLFLDGHYDLTDAPVHTFLPNFPDLKALVKRTPHEDEQFGYLAKSVLPAGYGPKEFDKNTSVDDDTTLINDPNHNFSDFSKTTSESTGQFGVPTAFESSVLHVFHGDFVPQRENKESMQSGNRCKTETERDEREGSLISVAESMSMKSRWNGISVRLKSHKEFYSDERDLRGHLERRAQQAILGENSVQRKLYLTEDDREFPSRSLRKGS